MPTYNPEISVLIPSVPSRIDAMRTLFDKLQAQIKAINAEGRVEVLALLDNKARSIGLKRQALLDASRGEYVGFLDDDDDIAPEYIADLIVAMALIDGPVNVIVFDQMATLNDDPPVLVRHGIEFENTELGPNGATRKPWHHNFWRADLAKSFRFPDCSYGEDAAWLKNLWDLTTPDMQIRASDKPLHFYRFRTDRTEAEHTFPGTT